MALVIVNIAPTKHHSPIKHHRPGCHTKKCDKHVDYIWYEKHHKKTHVSVIVYMSEFDKCVVFKESSDNQYASNGTDYSFYQWLPSTYDTAARMAGEKEKFPTEASLEEQTKAFNVYEPTNPGAWPVTVPACGGG